MAKSEHTYLKTHELSANMLTFDTSAEERRLRTQATHARTGRAAKTLVKEGRLRLTLVALRKGTVLGAHRVEGEVTLHVLRGRLEVQTEREAVRATKGSIIALQAGVPHEAEALSDSTLLITASMR
jgi:quercetin dioxygenase-like cupin family protein